MLTIESAHSPSYANKEKTHIDLFVKFAEFKDELPFTATMDDTAEHCILLFKNAKAGVYGKVKNYVELEKLNIDRTTQPITTGTQEI